MRTITYGSHSFAVFGTCVWYDVPATIRASSITLGEFQSSPKTIVLCSAYETLLGAFMTVWATTMASRKFSYCLTFLRTSG